MPIYMHMAACRNAVLPKRGDKKLFEALKMQGIWAERVGKRGRKEEGGGWREEGAGGGGGVREQGGGGEDLKKENRRK